MYQLIIPEQYMGVGQYLEPRRFWRANRDFSGVPIPTVWVCRMCKLVAALTSRDSTWLIHR